MWPDDFGAVAPSFDQDLGVAYLTVEEIVSEAMKAVFAPTAPIPSLMYSSGPRGMNTFVSASTTSVELSGLYAIALAACRSLR